MMLAECSGSLVRSFPRRMLMLLCGGSATVLGSPRGAQSGFSKGRSEAGIIWVTVAPDGTDHEIVGDDNSLSPPGPSLALVVDAETPTPLRVLVPVALRRRPRAYV